MFRRSILSRPLIRPSGAFSRTGESEKVAPWGVEDAYLTDGLWPRMRGCSFG